MQGGGGPPPEVNSGDDGGGAGGCIYQLVITPPTSVYTYSVGAGATLGNNGGPTTLQFGSTSYVCEGGLFGGGGEVIVNGNIIAPGQSAPSGSMIVVDNTYIGGAAGGAGLFETSPAPTPNPGGNSIFIGQPGRVVQVFTNVFNATGGGAASMFSPVAPYYGAGGTINTAGIAVPGGDGFILIEYLD